MKRIHFGCQWSPDFYHLLNVAVDQQHTNRVSMYARNILPWSNIPNKNGCQHFLAVTTFYTSNWGYGTTNMAQLFSFLKFIQDATDFPFLVKTLASENIFRHSKKNIWPSNWEGKNKTFLVGLSTCRLPQIPFYRGFCQNKSIYLAEFFITIFLF